MVMMQKSDLFASLPYLLYLTLHFVWVSVVSWALGLLTLVTSETNDLSDASVKAEKKKIVTHPTNYGK
mgnify:CR=1 FL=1